MFLNDLRKAFPQSTIKFHEPLNNYTYTKTGGPADVLIFPETPEEIQALVRFANKAHEPILVLGNSSNVIISDEGVSGVVLMLTEMDYIQIDGTHIKAGAGSKIIDVSRSAGAEGLTGFEFACGIPGSTGGAVYMNAGAYGGEISEVLVEVDVVTKAGRMYTLNNEDLNLSYRHSDLQETGDIVVEARFKLKKGDLQSILAKMDELTYLRESKQPLEYPSCGSVFKRPDGHFTGKLIQEAELQGYTIGGAQISKKHAGFIINVGGATATDYINMIHHIQEVIWDLNKVALEPEVRILGKRSKYDTVDAAFGN